MSTTIYWFSGTGNSLHVARSIAGGLQDDTEVMSIAAGMQDNKFAVPAGNRLGIVFPVYAMGPPRIVQSFIRKMPVEGLTSVFAVATYAGCLGSVFAVLQQRLGKRGLVLETAHAVKMPENYPPMGGAPGEEKKRRILEQSERSIQKVIDDLNCGRPGYFKKTNTVLRVIGKAVNPVFQKRVGLADKNFYTDEKCDGDGLCARVCPVDNIKMDQGRPTWQGHCEQCFACLHWCPQSALQYGRRSRKQPRYHHPATSLEDFSDDVR